MRPSTSKEGKKHGIAHLRALMPFVKRHWVTLAVGFAFMLVQNYGAMRVPSYFQKIVDEITGANRPDVIWHLIVVACIYAAVAVISLYLMRRLIIGASRQVEYSLRERIYDRLLELDYSFYMAHETGDLVSRTTNDLDHVRTLLGPGIMYIPNSLSMFAFFFPVLFRLNAALMAVATGVMVAVIAFVFIVLPRLQPFFLRIQEATGKINSRVWQVVTGISTVKLHTMEQEEERRFGELNREFQGRNMAAARVQEFLWPTFIFIFSLTQLVVIFIGGRQVISGAMSLGQLLQFNVMVSTLTFPVLSLGWIMSLIQQGISAMGRINAILDGPVERRDDWKRLDQSAVSFEVNDLRFAYPGHEKPSLDGVRLSIRAGEFIGITGTIGSGKSTLVNVLTGLLRPPRGMVFVNGMDIRDIEPASLFGVIGIVSQSPFLFSRTLAQNIAMAREGAPQQDVRQAAELAGLGPDIASFPDGYGQMVGERGITLSGGQKQRTAIARALMKDSPVVILDDALSAVDARTESTIIENLRSLHGRKTVLIVSHRISPLKEADCIYVMDDGKIAEQGTHAQLVSRGGLYERLVRYQQMEKSIAQPGAVE
ncbi:MAG TPA: ABC transporter ATP-binding protein [Spirochaetia bacterium]|nr:ABC transporter ATP-binding protein [Spirochaetia bacterium]